jgi:hypothetical protein
MKHKRFLNSNGGRSACDQLEAPSMTNDLPSRELCSNTKENP